MTDIIEPMEARQAEALPQGPGWQYEPKWDGFRCLASKQNGSVELQAKSGKSLTRYFPDMAAVLAALSIPRFVVDGELAIERAGALSFDDLQLRLHPAESRVRKLAAETPAMLILFDLLIGADGQPLTDAPLTERRIALEDLYAQMGGHPALRLTPRTCDPATAQAWLDGTGGAMDGVIAKRLDEPYQAGERAMVKVKRLRTADCVVGGFRYASSERQVGSLLLGLYDAEGLLHHVGFTSTFSRTERPALTRRLEGLIEPPGFTGKAPGGPSRWSNGRTAEWEPLRPDLVVEVRYDHVTGERFRHGTKLLRWRPDKAPRQCAFDQLATSPSPRVLEATLA
jgi:ATP-dependent DNA ligase